MSKRSRRQFDKDSCNARQIFRSSEKPAKRSRKNAPKSAADSENDSEYECPVCYEDFTGKIFQCQEGHLLCEQCHPQFTHCPTCKISLTPNIRNRILEQIISSKQSKAVSNSSKSKPKKKNVSKVYSLPPSHLCTLCRRSFASAEALDSHLHVCDQRQLRCPFDDCKWTDAFFKFGEHAKTAHHTCLGSKQTAPEDGAAYLFNHAIKFPKDTFERDTSDFVWPKIVRFKDGKDFLVLTRYNKDCITVFVRLMTLPTLNREERRRLKVAMGVSSQLRLGRAKEEILGKYWVEFRLKDKGHGSHGSHGSHGHSNRKRKDKDQNYDAVPLRWPCDLYGVTLPFSEHGDGRVLRIHRSIFTQYWTQENVDASAVLRFQFRAVLP